ncbi:MAG TPA: hypothetical protein DD432_01470 [Eubacterium sp.]|nr:hypothetical protein [Eubacterium sp.]
MEKESRRLLSIIIPVYNSEAFLTLCLQTIYNQNYHNWECILVDDESQDGSPEICKMWREKDSRFKYYRKKNGGVAEARNYGIDHSKGDYISFVDNDDLLHPMMYECLIDNLEKYNSEVSCCGYKKDFSSYEDVEKNMSSFSLEKNVVILDNREDIYYSIVKGNGIEGLVWNKVYRRDAIGNIKFDNNIALVDDADFSIRLFKNVNRVCYTEDVFYHWMQHNNNQTTIGAYTKYASAAKAYELMVREVEAVIENNKTLDTLKSHSLIWHLNACERGINERCLDREKKLYYKNIAHKYKKYACYYNRNVKLKVWLINNCYPGYKLYLYCKRIMEKFNDRRII